MAATKRRSTARKSATGKKASPAKPATDKPAGAAGKGKRYSAAKKKAVIDFVNSVNAERGRGGITAAAKKFGITALTISNWIKKAGAPATTGTTTGGAAAVTSRSSATSPGAGSSPAAVLQSLTTLQQEIDALEKLLAAKHAQFDRLKRKL